MDALELRAAVGFGSSQMAIYERPLAACCITFSRPDFGIIESDKTKSLIS